jgi:pyridoxal 5'-phosphate synthase pdxS subunit
LRKSHINKWEFKVPFVNGARSLQEALRRIYEGASMIRTKGEPGTGNVAEAVRHMKIVNRDIAMLLRVWSWGEVCSEVVLKGARRVKLYKLC